MLEFLCIAFLIALVLGCVVAPGLARGVGAALAVLFGSRERNLFD